MSKFVQGFLACLFTLTMGAAPAGVVDLYDTSTPTTAAAQGLWIAAFTPKFDLALTGLGLVFDPVVQFVNPSLYLSIWQDNINSNSNRLAILAPNMLNGDFMDLGLGHYSFLFSNYPAYGALDVVLLEANRNYFLLVQINIDGTWPRLGDYSQHFPYEDATQVRHFTSVSV